ARTRHHHHGRGRAGDRTCGTDHCRRALRPWPARLPPYPGRREAARPLLRNGRLLRLHREGRGTNRARLHDRGCRGHACDAAHSVREGGGYPMSFERETDLVVVGAGPGGLPAALTAADLGLQVTVTDEYPHPGGQFYKQLADGIAVGDRARLPYDYREGDALLAQVRAAPIEMLNGTLVWASFEAGTLSVRQRDAMGTIRFRAAIVASGATERAAAFPGWDLAGVMTPGGAQTLVKTQRLLPGQ